MKFRYTRRATDDLASIFEYLNARNPRYTQCDERNVSAEPKECW